MDDALLDPFARMLADLCTPATLRAADRGRDAILAAVSESGFLDAMRPEAEGGAALTLSEAEPLLRALGRAGAPAVIAEAMVAGRDATLPNGPLRAIVQSVQIAGLCERVLDMTLSHANERIQFGKPIGKQQAIQHQLAIVGEQTILVRIAAQAGCRAGLQATPEQAAIAKITASAAVPIVAGIAHAVLGAMGITADHDLHLFTRQLHAARAAAGSERYWARVLGTARLANAAKTTVDFVRGL